METYCLRCLRGSSSANKYLCVYNGKEYVRHKFSRLPTKEKYAVKNNPHEVNKGRTKEEIAFKELYHIWPNENMLMQWRKNNQKDDWEI